MRALSWAALVGMLALMAGTAAAGSSGGVDKPPRFAVTSARIEAGKSDLADSRFRLSAEVVRHRSSEAMEALGFRLDARLVAKGGSCSVPADIFQDGFEE